eukprot:jgi/Bigna1/91002/estExt_fgenesh1_pg.C_850070
MGMAEFVAVKYELSEMVTFTMDVLEKTEFPDIVALQSEGGVADLVYERLKSKYSSVVSWPRSCDLERGCTTTRVPYESDYKLHNETFSVAILSRYKIVSIDDIAMSVTLWLPAPIRHKEMKDKNIGLVIVAGGFNEPSELDWTQSAFEANIAPMYVDPVGLPISHNIIGRDVLAMTDAFREIHPDEVARPGHTWPVNSSAIRSDRIDMLYYKCPAARRCLALNASLVGDGAAAISDIVVTPWKSTHRAVRMILNLTVFGEADATTFPTPIPTISWSPTRKPTGPTQAPTPIPTLPPHTNTTGSRKQDDDLYGMLVVIGNFTFRGGIEGSVESAYGYGASCTKLGKIEPNLWRQMEGGLFKAEWLVLSSSSSSTAAKGSSSSDDGDDFLTSFCINSATKWGIQVHFNLTFKPNFLRQALGVYNALNDKAKGPAFLAQPFISQFSEPSVSAFTRYIPTAKPTDSKSSGKASYSHDSNDGVIMVVIISVGLVAILGGLCFTTCSYIRSKNRERVHRWLPSHRRIRSQEFSEDQEGDESGGIRMRSVRKEDSYYDDDDYVESSGSPMLDLTAVFNDDDDN